MQRRHIVIEPRGLCYSPDNPAERPAPNAGDEQHGIAGRHLFTRRVAAGNWFRAFKAVTIGVKVQPSLLRVIVAKEVAVGVCI
jgi:hypothetical protein